MFDGYNLSYEAALSLAESLALVTELTRQKLEKQNKGDE